MSRPETGPMKFGDDWRGIFIRGDNAGYYALVLEHIETLIPDGDFINRGVVHGLRMTLCGADERYESKETQIMKSFDECKKQ